jgi:NADH-quinone oxidoreductase subunit J
MIKNIGHTELVGREIFTNFLLPFEVTSILLLVAIVGAVILAKKKI